MPTNIHATISAPIKDGASPSRVVSPTQIRNSKTPFANSLATDVENLSKRVNELHSELTAPPSISQLLLTDSTTGEVTAAFGDFVFQGVRYTNYLNEIHVGDPLGTHNPTQALFNANKDGTVTIGQNGKLDVLDPFGIDAAWIGTQNDLLSVTGAANNGAGLIRLTVPGVTLITGNAGVLVSGVGGVPNATGNWTITKIDASHVDLQGSVWAGAYTSGGTIDRVIQITGAANNGAGLIRLTSGVAHGYETGDKSNIALVGGVPNATGQWVVTVINATHFDLIGSTWAGGYTAGGTSLRYFAGMLAQTVAIGSSFPNYSLRAFADGSLRIRNATISLVSANGSIVLDPTIPAIVVTKTGGGSVTIDGTLPGIVFASAAGTVTIDASAASIVVKNAAAATVASFSNGSTPELLGVHVTGGAAITGTLASGSATVTGTLSVTSTAATGTLTVTGDISATGVISAATLDVGNLVLTGSLQTSSASGTVTIDAATASLIITNAASGVVASFGAGGTPELLGAHVTGNIVATGTISGTIIATGGANGPVSISGLTLNFSNGIYTGQSGSFATGGGSGTASISGLLLNFSNGYFISQSGSFSFTTSGVTGTATVRNAAGTGTSAFTLVNGLVTNYVP